MAHARNKGVSKRVVPRLSSRVTVNVGLLTGKLRGVKCNHSNAVLAVLPAS